MTVAGAVYRYRRPEEAAALDDALASDTRASSSSRWRRYDAGRRGGSWRKVKPVRTLDLVVLAASGAGVAEAGSRTCTRRDTVERS
jgi:hypothetical protein